MSVRIGNRKAASNTGFVGITETFVRQGDKQLPCFSVSWRGRRYQRNHAQVYYGRRRSREEALQIAQAKRAKGIAAREEHEARRAKR
jgi:hypothetical protein